MPTPKKNLQPRSGTFTQNVQKRPSDTSPYSSPRPAPIGVSKHPLGGVGQKRIAGG